MAVAVRVIRIKWTSVQRFENRAERRERQTHREREKTYTERERERERERDTYNEREREGHKKEGKKPVSF